MELCRQHAPRGGLRASAEVSRSSGWKGKHGSASRFLDVQHDARGQQPMLLQVSKLKARGAKCPSQNTQWEGKQQA